MVSPLPPQGGGLPPSSRLGGLSKPGVCPHSSHRGDQSLRPSPCCRQAPGPPPALVAVLNAWVPKSKERAPPTPCPCTEPGCPASMMLPAGLSSYRLLGRCGGSHGHVLLPEAKPPGLCSNRVVLSSAFKAISGLRSFSLSVSPPDGLTTPYAGLPLLSALSLNCHVYSAKSFLSGTLSGALFPGKPKTRPSEPGA